MERSYPITFFSRICISHRNKKTQIIMYKPVNLGLPLLEISKIVMLEIWYHYVKPKYKENAKLCFIDTDRLKIYIKTNLPRDLRRNSKRG